MAAADIDTNKRKRETSPWEDAIDLLDKQVRCLLAQFEHYADLHVQQVVHKGHERSGRNVALLAVEIDNLIGKFHDQDEELCIVDEHVDPLGEIHQIAKKEQDEIEKLLQDESFEPKKSDYTHHSKKSSLSYDRIQQLKVQLLSSLKYLVELKKVESEDNEE